MTLPELTDALKEMGQPGFRAKQIYTWLHKGVRSYDEMTNISKELRTELSQRYPFTPPEVVRRQQSQRDGTIKYLWRLADGNCVETVLMRYHYTPLRRRRWYADSSHSGTVPSSTCGVWRTATAWRRC